MTVSDSIADSTVSPPPTRADRLASTLALIRDLASTVDSHEARTIARLAQDALEYSTCSPTCTALHPVALIARYEGVTRQAVYLWIKAGMPAVDVGDEKRVRHDVARGWPVARKELEARNADLE